MSHPSVMIRKLLDASIIRYLGVAVAGVGLELALFWLMTTGMGLSYLIATPVSTALVIIFNWYASRIFVFKNRHHSARKELILVTGVSLVGIAIQVAVTATAVEILKTTPFIGKLTAIGVSFFWNYWARRKYIYPKDSRKGTTETLGGV